MNETCVAGCGRSAGPAAVNADAATTPWPPCGPAVAGVAASAAEQFLRQLVADGVSGRTCRECLNDVADLIVSAENQYTCLRSAPQDLGGRVDAVGSGQPDIHQDDIGEDSVDEFEGFGGRRRFAYDVVMGALVRSRRTPVRNKT
jgi:hypothetical protein